MSRNTSSRPHRVGDEAWLPFAEGEDGRMVHVKNVPNGKKCGCICPECRGPLIAYQPRTKRTAYFGHYTAAACDPPRALETMLHKLAKQLIEERKQVRVPPVVAVLGETHSELFKGGIFRPESVRVEEAVPGMRPDIIATLGQKQLFIEVAVRHKVGAEKLALIKERRHSTIEIDLAKWRHETDEAKLAQAIIYDAPRVWLFNNTSYETEAAWLATQEESARKRLEHATELANAILRGLSAPPLKEAPPDSIFAECVAAVEDAGMADQIGVTISGSGAFGVAEEIWQAVVLDLLLRQPAVIVQHIPLIYDNFSLLTATATLALRDNAADWTVVEQITAGKVRYPRAAIRDYLEHLCERGIAMRYGVDQYAAIHAVRQRAHAAWREKQTRLDRHAAIRKAFEEISNLVGAPTMTFEAWIDVRHEGIEATPSEIADQSERDLSTLLDRMRRIGDLVKANAAIVEGGLLGFPAEKLLAARKADAERRQQEARERVAARVAAEQARRATEAAARLQSIRTETQQIEGGEALLHAPLKELDGRSIEQTGGWMSPTEALLVLGLIRGRQDAARKKSAKESAALAEAERWREQLDQKVTEMFGQERGALVLRSRYPKTRPQTLRDYCIDERTYKICLSEATEASKAHRRK